MDQLRVKNHYVPECYLKRWEGSDEKVCVYKILVPHQNIPEWKRHYSSSIGYVKHLYTQYVSGNESDDVEKWMDKEYESPANNALDKAIQEKRLSSDDWYVLIRFLAAQDVRTPKRLLEHLERNNIKFADLLQNTLNEFKEKLEKGEFVGAKNNYTVNVENSLFPLKVTTTNQNSETSVIKVESYVGRSTWLFSLKHLLNNTEKHLHNHKWSIVKPAKGYYFFTSDNPVVKLNYSGPKNYNLHGGWGKHKGNIIFPIGPEHAMFVQIGDRPILKNTRLTVAQTQEFRKFVAENSYRMIVSNHFDRYVHMLKPRLVDRNRYLRERHELDNWHSSNVEKEKEFYNAKENA